MKKLFKYLFFIIIALGLGFVILTYTNNEVHEGVVTSKIQDKNKSDVYYIILDNDTTIKNSSLMFKSTETSKHMQDRIKLGDKVEIETLGYDNRLLRLHKTAYSLEVKGHVEDD